jgi:hypothetical protein
MSESYTRGLRFRCLRAGVLSGAAILAALMAGFIARFFLESGLAWRCPSMTLLGIPCPGCGTTRAFAALAQFDLTTALRLNPLMMMALLLVLLAPFLKLSWESFEQRRGWLILGIVVGFNWLYLLFFLPR